MCLIELCAVYAPYSEALRLQRLHRRHGPRRLRRRCPVAAGPGGLRRRRLGVPRRRPGGSGQRRRLGAAYGAPGASQPHIRIKSICYIWEIYGVIDEIYNDIYTYIRTLFYIFLHNYIIHVYVYVILMCFKLFIVWIFFFVMDMEGIDTWK